MNKILSLALTVVLLPACVTVEGPETADVEAQQLDGAWVFTYSEAPDAGMHALHGGAVSVEDGCLLVGDAVVVWYDHHLDDVEDAIARVAAGEEIALQVGGGGLSLEEGSTADDFPPVVLERCDPTELWYSSDEAVTIEETL